MANFKIRKKEENQKAKAVSRVEFIMSNMNSLTGDEKIDAHNEVELLYNEYPDEFKIVYAYIHCKSNLLSVISTYEIANETMDDIENIITRYEAQSGQHNSVTLVELLAQALNYLAIKTENKTMMLEVDERLVRISKKYSDVLEIDISRAAILYNIIKINIVKKKELTNEFDIVLKKLRALAFKHFFDGIIVIAFVASIYIILNDSISEGYKKQVHKKYYQDYIKCFNEFQDVRNEVVWNNGYF